MSATSSPSLNHLYNAYSNSPILTKDLSETQFEDEKIEQLRARLKDLPKKIQRDSSTLNRFLVANSEDVMEAEKSLREYLKWREEYKPEKIKKGDFPNAMKTSKLFIHGKDKLGRPCLVVHPYRHDPKTRDLEETFKMVIYWIEKAIKKLKPGVDQFVVIYDARLSSHYNQTDWALVKELMRLKDYYPQRLGAIYVIKPNWIFHVLFSMLASILDKNVVSKVVIFDDNFRDALKKLFHENDLLHGHGGPSTRSGNIRESLNSLRESSGSWDSQLDINSIPDVEKYKLTLDAENDAEKKKKIAQEMMADLESNLVISDIHKDLLKNALNHILINPVSKSFTHSFNGEKMDTAQVKYSIKSASVLRDKCDKIQLDLANLAIRKQQLENILKEAELARSEMPEIELQLDQKRKDLNDAMKFMKNAEEMENKLSIVSHAARRQELIDKTPKLAIKIPGGVEITTLYGPEKDGHNHSQFFMDFIAAKSISLYPSRKESGREGDPIADRFAICHYENSTIFAIADGCGWGTPSKEAATVACNVFVQYMNNFKNEISSTAHAVKIMLRAFSAAHCGIVDSANYLGEDIGAGTTTMLGGMTFELAEETKDGKKHAMILVNLGDCYAYIYSNSKERVLEVGEELRIDNNDVKDPGGRLGPYLEGGQPDLRNLEVYFSTIDRDDVIVLLSDGVYDNLDPMWCGVTPKDANIVAEDNNWNHVKNDYFTCKLKNDWTLKFVTSLLTERTEKEKKSTSHSNLVGSPGMKKLKLTPSYITDKLITHSFALTRNSRTFMETYPNKKLPDDKNMYPGKMDHATCLCFRI